MTLNAENMHTYRCVDSYAVHLHLHTYGDGPMCYQTNAFKSLQLKVGCAYMYVRTYLHVCMYQIASLFAFISSSSFVRLVCTLNMWVSALCLYIRIRVYLPKFLHMHTYTKNTRVHTYTSIFMKPLSIILK